MATFNDLHLRRYEPQPLTWKGRYVENWFSNFQAGERPIRFSGLVFRTIEEAFQAAKWTDQARRQAFVGIGPSAAKREGRKRQPPMRTDWESVCIAAMDGFLRQKFQPGTRDLERLMAMTLPPVEVTN